MVFLWFSSHMTHFLSEPVLQLILHVLHVDLAIHLHHRHRAAKPGAAEPRGLKRGNDGKRWDN